MTPSRRPSVAIVAFALLLGGLLSLCAAWPVGVARSSAMPELSALQWLTAGTAQAALSALGTPFVWQGDLMRHADGFAAQVDLDCTALWLAWLLIGGLVLFGLTGRGSPRRLLPAMLVGVAMIAVVNQLRLMAMLWLGVHMPQQFGWVHEWLSPLLLVALGGGFVALALGPALRPPARICPAALGSSASPRRC